jgi:hypothetical protein
MLCDRCSAALQSPNFSPFYAYDTRRQRSDDELEILHPSFASLENALRTDCHFCHRLVAALAKAKGSKILQDSKLSDDVEHESFRVRYQLAYLSRSMKSIKFTAVFCAMKSGVYLEQKCTETLYLSPGTSKTKAPASGVLTDDRTSSYTERLASRSRQWNQYTIIRHHKILDQNMSNGPPALP